MNIQARDHKGTQDRFAPLAPSIAGLLKAAATYNLMLSICLNEIPQYLLIALCFVIPWFFFRHAVAIVILLFFILHISSIILPLSCYPGQPWALPTCFFWLSHCIALGMCSSHVGLTLVELPETSASIIYNIFSEESLFCLLSFG